MKPDGPRYRQIADQLLSEIGSGQLAVGKLLEPEAGLARRFRVSRGTLRQALGMLEDQGVIVRRQRIGTKVLARFPGRGMVNGEQLLEDWARYGIEYPLKVRSVSNRRPPPELFQGEAAGRRQWLHVVGLRYPVGSRVPIAYCQVYINPRYREVEHDLRTAGVPMFALVERRYGRVIETVQMNVSALELPADMAQALGARAGQAALQLTRFFLDAARDVVTVATNTHPAGRYAYSVEIPRQHPAGDQPEAAKERFRGAD